MTSEVEQEVGEMHISVEQMNNRRRMSGKIVEVGDFWYYLDYMFQGIAVTTLRYIMIRGGSIVDDATVIDENRERAFSKLTFIVSSKHVSYFLCGSNLPLL